MYGVQSDICHLCLPIIIHRNQGSTKVNPSNPSCEKQHPIASKKEVFPGPPHQSSSTTPPPSHLRLQIDICHLSVSKQRLPLLSPPLLKHTDAIRARSWSPPCTCLTSARACTPYSSSAGLTFSARKNSRWAFLVGQQLTKGCGGGGQRGDAYDSVWLPLGFEGGKGEAWTGRPTLTGRVRQAKRVGWRPCSSSRPPRWSRWCR